MKKLLLLFFILPFYNCSLYAQSDAAFISELIKDIETTQVKQTGEFYAGMCPTYRECAGFPHNYKPDNNIFFTAITAFTLRNMMHRLPVDIKIKTKQIIENVKPAYRHYRNPNGNPYYSFWPANAPILPHSFYFEHLTGIFAQGDDADDSVMILMTGDNNDSDNKALKQRMQQQSNLSRRKIKSTYKKYRKIPAYCTYLGDQMHPDFDFAVQCNILYFVLDKKLPLVKQDSATIDLLARMLKNREYIKAPVYISPYYGKPAVLLYHVARLMGTFKIKELQQYKDQLVADANLLLTGRINMMEQVILRSSLLYLNAAAPPLAVNSLAAFEKSNQDKFVFFMARAAFAYSTPFKQIFLNLSYLNYFFYCPTYNKVLLLEYLSLKNDPRLQQKN